MWKLERTQYVGLSHIVLSCDESIEYWNENIAQKSVWYYPGPFGRAYGGRESYEKNNHEWSPGGWKSSRYYHYDIRGNVSAVTLDKPGLAGETYYYGPFGEILDGEHRWGWEHKGDQHLGFEPIGYTGTSIDAESGLYHYPYREYDPLTAQFTTEDPIKDGEMWYALCAQNPLKYVDSLGLGGHGNNPGECGGSAITVGVDSYEEEGGSNVSTYTPGSKYSSAQKPASLSAPEPDPAAPDYVGIYNEQAYSDYIDYLEKNRLAILPAKQEPNYQKFNNRCASHVHYVWDQKKTKHYYKVWVDKGGGRIDVMNTEVITKAQYDAKKMGLSYFCNFSAAAASVSFGGLNLQRLKEHGPQFNVVKIYNNLKAGVYDNDVGKYIEVSFKTAWEYAAKEGLAFAINPDDDDPAKLHIATFSQTNNMQVYHVGNNWDPGYMTINKAFGYEPKHEYMHYFIWVKP